MLPVLLVLGTMWLAWSNGANDNFKGVATLYGSRTLSYGSALALATVATVAGGLLSVLMADGLVKTFSGQGVITEGMVNNTMLASTGVAAGATVLLATALGMPTSTTHALTGALVGTALVAGPSGVNAPALAHKFAQPLLLSPVLAIVLTGFLYLTLHRIRRWSGVASDTCICVSDGGPGLAAAAATDGAVEAASVAPAIVLRAGTVSACTERYAGTVVGIDAQSGVDALHCLSAGAVCFARAVNDTPKIAAILLTAGAAGSLTSRSWTLALVTLAAALGGLVQGRRVARTMSQRITDLNTGQGLTANLVTALLVFGASWWGLPVSTTHVSCGAIFGISAVNGKRRWRTIRQVVATWVTTLPLGLVMGASLYWVLRTWGM